MKEGDIITFYKQPKQTFWQRLTRRQPTPVLVKGTIKFMVGDSNMKGFYK